MVLQLILGSIAISVTIAIEVAAMEIAMKILGRVGPWLSTPPYTHKTMISLIGVTLWLLGAISASVWVWAALYIGIGEFHSLEPALYFSVVAFTTLGFGDIILPLEWRLLSGLCAANGLLLFGLSAAFLVEFIRQMWQSQSKISPRG
jgi:hypothetical protein